MRVKPPVIDHAALHADHASAETRHHAPITPITPPTIDAPPPLKGEAVIDRVNDQAAAHAWVARHLADLTHDGQPDALAVRAALELRHERGPGKTTTTDVRVRREATLTRLGVNATELPEHERTALALVAATFPGASWTSLAESRDLAETVARQTSTQNTAGRRR